MKTFILNGSPRKKGDISALIDRMQDVLDGEILSFSAFHDDISPCMDCRFCRANNGCAVNDKMHEIYKCIESFDNVIVASPIYFFGLTGPLLNILSRFQVYFSEVYRDLPVRGKRKNGTIILTGGGSGGFNEAEKSARTMLHIMNANWIGTVSSLNTDILLASQDNHALRQAEKVALELNSLFEKGC